MLCLNNWYAKALTRLQAGYPNISIAQLGCNYYLLSFLRPNINDLLPK